MVGHSISQSVGLIVNLALGHSVTDTLSVSLLAGQLAGQLVDQPVTVKKSSYSVIAVPLPVICQLFSLLCVLLYNIYMNVVN